MAGIDGAGTGRPRFIGNCRGMTLAAVVRMAMPWAWRCPWFTPESGIVAWRGLRGLSGLAVPHLRTGRGPPTDPATQPPGASPGAMRTKPRPESLADAMACPQGCRGMMADLRSMGGPAACTPDLRADGGRRRRSISCRGWLGRRLAPQPCRRTHSNPPASTAAPLQEEGMTSDHASPRHLPARFLAPRPGSAVAWAGRPQASAQPSGGSGGHVQGRGCAATSMAGSRPQWPRHDRALSTGVRR